MIKLTFVEGVYQSPDRKFAIIQIHKNASTTTQAMFRSLGWKRIPTIAPEAKIIACLQDPMVRWMKGLIQFCNSARIDMDTMDPALMLGIFDNHTAPISLLHPDIFHRIHFIPLDHPTLTLPEAIQIETGLIVKDFTLHVTEDKEAQEAMFVRLRQLDHEAPRRKKITDRLKFDIEAYNKMKKEWNYK